MVPGLHCFPFFSLVNRIAPFARVVRSTPEERIALGTCD